MKNQESISQEQSAIDRACLRELRELISSNGRPDRFRSLLETFQDGLGSQLEQMKLALAVGNSENMTELAHSLKGSAATVGAVHLSMLCASLETASLSAHSSEAEHILCQIEREAESVCDILQQEMGA